MFAREFIVIVLSLPSGHYHLLQFTLTTHPVLSLSVPIHFLPFLQLPSPFPCLHFPLPTYSPSFPSCSHFPTFPSPFPSLPFLVLPFPNFPHPPLILLPFSFLPPFPSPVEIQACCLHCSGLAMFWFLVKYTTSDVMLSTYIVRLVVHHVRSVVNG